MFIHSHVHTVTLCKVYLTPIHLQSYTVMGIKYSIQYPNKFAQSHGYGYIIPNTVLYVLTVLDKLYPKYPPHGPTSAQAKRHYLPPQEHQEN